MDVKNLCMYYDLLGDRYVKAVDNVSLELHAGETLGIVGESGCGKSSMAITLLRLLPSNAKIMGGKVSLHGEDILALPEAKLRRDVRWKKISMVFQGAMNSFNPVIKVGDQLAETLLSHDGKATKKEAIERARELLDLVGIEGSKADHYPHEFSGGMKQRAMIAMALSLNPEIVIADEPTTALDVIVQAQVLKLLKDLKEERDMSLILISHDISIIAEMSDDVAVMYAGHIVEYGESKSVFLDSRHPYTKGLLEAVPSVKARKQKLESIPGAPPNLIGMPDACRFADRCKYAIERCRQGDPPLEDVGDGRVVACIRSKELWGAS